MKIEFKKKNLKAYGEVQPGEVFRWKENYYLKIVNKYDNGFSSVNLERNQVDTFNLETKVIVLAATLQIEEE